MPYCIKKKKKENENERGDYRLFYNSCKDVTNNTIIHLISDVF